MHKIKFDLKNILIFIGILLSIWFVYRIRTVIVTFFITFVLYSTLNIAVNKLQKQKVPRPIATVSIILLIFLGIGIFIYTLVPTIFDQTGILIKTLPNSFNDLFNSLDIKSTLGQNQVDKLQQTASDNFQSILSEFSKNLFSFSLNIFNFGLTVLTVVVLTTYLVINDIKVKLFIINLLPSENQEEMGKILTKIEKNLGSWMSGQLILMGIIGVLTFIALSVLNIPFALPLALLACLLEIIPFIGSTIAAFPAILLAFSQSPSKALLTLLTYFLIQQIESYILIPTVMRRTNGLNSVIVIMAIMVGSDLLGPLGALLAIPTTVVLVILYDEWKVKRHDEHLAKTQ